MREYGRLAELDSFRIHALTQKSRLHIQAEQWQPAANDLTVLLAARPDDHELRMLRATAWEKLGRNDECVEDLSAVIRDQPDSSTALKRRANLLLELKRVDPAIDDLTLLHRLHPDDSDIQLKLADLCLLQGRYDRVFGAVSDVPEADPNAAALFYLRGAAHFEQHQAVEARDWLTRAIKLQEDHTDARMLRAILLLNSDEPQEALDDLQVVASKTEPGPELLELRARALLKTGRNLESLNDLNSILRKNPDALDVRRLRCQTRLNTGDIEGAVDDATLILESDPADRAVRLLRADAAMALKNHSDAAVDYEKLLADPDSAEDDVDLLWKLCQCHLQIEDHPAVLRELDAILDARPNHLRHVSNAHASENVRENSNSL